MKKWCVLVVLVVLIVLAGLAGLGAAEWFASAAPEPGSASSLPEPTTPPADASARAPVPDSSERVQLQNETPPATGTRLRLVDGSGAAVGGLAYWADERPFDYHPGRAPQDAPRTLADGSLSLDLLGTGAYLWFELDEGTSFAWERADLAELETLSLPTTRSVPVEVRGLPADSAWRISAWPAWVDGRDGGMEHGPGRADKVYPTGAGPVRWAVRRRVQRTSQRGPARTRFELVEGLPTAFYCQPAGHEVEPEIQVLTDPPAVVARAGAPWAGVSFEVVEADGSPSSMRGRAAVYAAGRRVTWTESFEGGACRVHFDSSTAPADRRLAVVLHDGEVFTPSLAEANPSSDTPVRLVRGQGRAALLELELDDRLRDMGEPRWIHLRLNGDRRYVSRFEHFTPVPDDDEDSLGAWVHEGKLVVQSERLEGLVDELRLATVEGLVAERAGDRLVPLETIELDPLDPRALIEQMATPHGADRLVLIQEVAWRDSAGEERERWSPARSLHFRWFEDFGWRYYHPSSTNQHYPLPASLPLTAPRDERSRWRVSLDGGTSPSGWVELDWPTPR